MHISSYLLMLGTSYTLGCCLTGYYLVRIRTGQDIRQSGSGSAGATNVGRLLGPTGFWITLVGDALKGALAVSISHFLSPVSSIGLAAMLLVVAGHIWPCQLGFRGGKGVAPALGALLGYDLRLALLTLLLFAIVFGLSRKRTVSVLAAILLCPLLSHFLSYSLKQQLGLWSVVLLLGFAHRDNLRVVFSASHRHRNSEHGD